MGYNLIRFFKKGGTQPKIQDPPDEEGVLLEGDFVPTPLTTLPLTQHHLAVDDTDRVATNKTMALGQRTLD